MLKVSKVIPIFKKDDEFIAGNYRPISILSVFHKLMETLMYKRLIKKGMITMTKQPNKIERKQPKSPRKKY